MNWQISADSLLFNSSEMTIRRRNFLKTASLFPALAFDFSPLFRRTKHFFGLSTFRRVRPSDPFWPSEKEWQKLNESVHGQLFKVDSPLTSCKEASSDSSCAEVFKELKNPYYIGDHAALTQTSGWAGAWNAQPSVYVVAAKTSADVVAAVNFARIQHLRLVVKGGGHSYQGTSNARDSLLVWTKEMTGIEMHDQFVGQHCSATPQPAVTIESGAIWMQAYDIVTTKGGKYVQGGGCATVGVAGLIQSGGFGSYSKKYGLAAGGLLEAEIVLADGSVVVTNASNHPDLFWAIKGGGGGSFGVITKLTLRTRELPELFSRISGRIKAKDDNSFRMLISEMLLQYRNRLFNNHWGEQMTFNANNSVSLNMNYQGPADQSAQLAWKDFEQLIRENPAHYTFEEPLTFDDMPARHYWDPVYLRQNFPQRILTDDRPGEPSLHAYWTGSREETGIYLYGYKSTWLSAGLLEENNQAKLAEALFTATRYWSVTLHFNKGLAGAAEDEIAAAKDTAMNPAVLDAFALAIVAGGTDPVFPGITGHEPDSDTAKIAAENINHSFHSLLAIIRDPGSYVSEGDYFQNNWQHAFWGSNHARLADVKKKYDPQGLFFVHHGIGSEQWNSDGFERLHSTSSL